MCLKPAGFIIEFENGFKVCHLGDTGLFGDMSLIGSYYQPDLVMIPIGGHFVMNPKDAAYATRHYLKPKFAIPKHYDLLFGNSTQPSLSARSGRSQP